jgi:hypothetical protein
MIIKNKYAKYNILSRDKITVRFEIYRLFNIKFYQISCQCLAGNHFSGLSAMLSDNLLKIIDNLDITTNLSHVFPGFGK